MQLYILYSNDLRRIESNSGHMSSRTVHYYEPGAGPTNDISIEFEIRTKFAVLWYKIK